MDELMIFMTGFIAGLFVMGIIAAMANQKEKNND